MEPDRGSASVSPTVSPSASASTPPSVSVTKSPNSPPNSTLEWLSFIYDQGKSLVELHNDALESLRRRQIDPYKAKFMKSGKNKRTKAVVMQLDQIFKKTVKDLGELNEGMMREFGEFEDGEESLVSFKREKKGKEGEEDKEKVKGESDEDEEILKEVKKDKKLKVEESESEEEKDKKDDEEKNLKVKEVEKVEENAEESKRKVKKDKKKVVETVESEEEKEAVVVEEGAQEEDPPSDISDTTVFVSKNNPPSSPDLFDDTPENDLLPEVPELSPPSSPFVLRTQVTPINKLDTEKPSTSKKALLKLSHSEEKARKGVLSSDSEEEVKVVKVKKLRKKKKKTEVNIETDKKLKNGCKVSLIKLDKEIERELAEKGSVVVNGSESSDDDLGALERAVRDLEKYNAVITRKSHALQKPRTPKKAVKKIHTDSDSSKSAPDSDFESPKPLIQFKPLNQILETSDLEDLPDIEEEKTNKVKQAVKQKKQKNYVTPKIDSESSSETEKIISDSDSSVIIKKKRKQSSSDSSNSSDFINKKRKKSSDSDSSKKKKKRKRIKEETSTDSDIEEVDRVQGSQRRKNIREIIKDKNLKEDTKKAEREEEERKKRVEKRQEEFNGIFTNLQQSSSIQRLPLELDPKTKEILIEVDESIVNKLKPHQIKGIKFMYETCFESLEMIEKGKQGGCILAHCMGLGKTLQTVAFTTTILQNRGLTKVNKILIVCPLNTVTNWFKEYQMWTDELPTDQKPKLHALYDGKNLSARVENLKIFDRRGGVGIIHYDMFRNLVHTAIGKTKSKTVTSRQKELIKSILLEGVDLVVCDEGHLLKNHKSKLSISLSQIKTKRRIVLTGTPLQNNLVEYHTMVDFVKPNLLGSLKEFQNRFVHPIKNGQCKDSSERDVKVMKRRAHVLHSKLDGCVQRLDYSELTPYLPPKYEYCLIIKLSEKQKELYKEYIENVVPSDTLTRAKQLLAHYSVLVKILAHPIVLTMSKSIEKSDEEGSIKDFINDEEDKTSESDSDIEIIGEEKKKSTRANPIESPVASPLAPQGQWWSHLFEKKQDMYDMTLSGKLIVLQQILKTCETIGDRVLVFSQYLTTLDIIEEFLGEWDQNEEPGRWRSGIEYFRIDGGTKSEQRQKSCDVFNNKGAMRAKLFLISTRAGGLGINLYGANRVIIFDASWNPSNDMQSIFRVYRFGQQKPCYIYRFVAEATMEEKIYNRQVVKLSLSSRVIDEHQVERHFKFDDITEMYKFDPEEVIERKTVAVPKDRLLADLLINQKDWISTYFEHDTLLINKEDETLTEEERKQAWEEYTNENERVVLPQQVVHATDQATYMKIKIKLRERFDTASEMQINSSAIIVLQKVQELRSLMQKINLERGKLSGVEIVNLEARIGRLQNWISAALNSGNNNGGSGIVNNGFANNGIVNGGNGINNGYNFAPNIMRRVPDPASTQRGMFEALQMARAMHNGSDIGRARVGVTGQVGPIPPVQAEGSGWVEPVTLD